jgi:hypothetical protein
VVRTVRSAVASLFGVPLAPAALPSAAPATSTAPTAGRSRRRKKRASPQTFAKTRWYQRDVESAQHQASNGDLGLVGRLYRAFARDGYAQLLGTRAGGLIRLPKRFKGDPEAVAFLEAGAFKKALPSAELELMDRDGFVVGVSIAEFLDVDGLPYPVLCRLDPEFLRYHAWEDAWYYQTTSRLERVVPGDGRWVLHLRGGRVEPWNNGIWPALGRAFVSKEHALYLRDNWLGKLANAARAAVSPQGASEEHAQSWFQKVMAWGVNTVFGMRPGYDVKLIESNGRGFEGFKESIADANQEFMVAISGSTVLVDGGTGFSNQDVHKSIRADLIQGDGDALAETLDEQALPIVLEGNVPIGCCATVAWDTRPVANMKAEAEALVAAAKAITDLRAALEPDGIPLDTRALCARFAAPVRGDVDGDAIPDEEMPDGSTGNDEAEMDPADAPELTDEDVALLAAEMTRHGIARCEHQRVNRCRDCGIERTRGFKVGKGGVPAWRVSWRPIRRRAVAA